MNSTNLASPSTAAADASSAWSVRWYQSARELPAELWSACFGPPVEGLWWYLALEDSGLEAQFQFSYALLEKDGRAAGIAPTFVFNVPMDLVAPPLIARFLRLGGRAITSLQYQRTLFVGSPCSDEGTVGLIDSADAPAAFQALQAALPMQARSVKAPMIVWKDFPEENRSAFAPLVRNGALFEIVSYPGTRLTLPGKDFAAFLGAISSAHRNKLKKKLSRSRAMGPLEVSVVREPGASTREEIFGLFWQTYLKGKTKFEILNRTFFEKIAAYDGAHFVLIRDPATAKLIAFMLCFQIGPRVINKFIGLDYAYGGNWYLYFRLLEAAIDWAAKRGVNDFQSGQTGYVAKLDTSHHLVPLTNYCRHRNPLLNWIFTRVARGINWSSLDDDLKTWVLAHPDQARAGKST